MRSSVILGIVFTLISIAMMRGQDNPILRNTVDPAPDKIIHISIFVEAGSEKVFAYFTNSELLQSWLTIKADVEPKVGGKYELYWQPDDRDNNSTIGCRITAFETGQLLAFQWRSPVQFKPFANAADPLTHVTVVFIPEGDGTRVHVVHSGWRSSSEWEEARVWQVMAWNRALKELERVINQ